LAVCRGNAQWSAEEEKDAQAFERGERSGDMQYFQRSSGTNIQTLAILKQFYRTEFQN
jgi:hypothetical protein